MRKREEIDELREEALRVHAEFLKIRAALRDKPDDPELKSRKKQARERYKSLGREIAEAVAGQGETENDDAPKSPEVHEPHASPPPHETADTTEASPQEQLQGISRTQRSIKQKAEPPVKFREKEPLSDSKKTSSLRVLHETDIRGESPDAASDAPWLYPEEEDIDTVRFQVTDRKFHQPVLYGPKNRLERAIAGTLGSIASHPIRWVLAVLLTTAGVIGFLQNTVFGLYQVPNDNMNPALHAGDLLIYWKTVEFQRGDVVILEHPQRPDTHIALRIVAIADDTVEVRRKRLRVNEVPIHENYIDDSMTYTFQPLKIGPDEAFVLADHRNTSEDSHKWGFGVPQENIVGVAGAVVWPIKRWTRLGSHRIDFEHLSSPPLYDWERDRQDR